MTFYNEETGEIKQSYFDGVITLALKGVQHADREIITRTNGALNIRPKEPHNGSSAFTWSSVNKCTRFNFNKKTYILLFFV
ncbi:hypothetical protein BFC18_14745 [Alteromonas confluentis]|uniref:Uncharacterized protein n=1 Tax=Alteromonas confluentis TaxID=1656094 RepID=A0A1E7ZA74_9ALTE|nr:hypothetical protein BFC18_14745 [Alteromonas confluentis]